jgi:uncharacterized protein (DUF433 family)
VRAAPLCPQIKAELFGHTLELQDGILLAYIEDMEVALENDAKTVPRRLDECVEKDPARLGGEPVFRGTRVPVKSLFDHLSAGDSLEVFLDDFQGVTREQARVVLDAAGLHLVEEVR